MARNQTDTLERPTAEQALRATSNEALLRTFAALTHRMHSSREEARTEAELRGHRDMVQAEVLRRMGGH